MDEIEIGPLSIRAEVLPDSINEEKRTADVVFSTGAPVLRKDMWTGETWREVLSLKKDHVRLDRLNSGAPFLDTHSAFDLSSVLGVVVEGSAKVTGKQASARVRFSKRATVEPVWQDIRDGIIRNVSVGYRVHKFEQVEPAGDEKIPTRTAIDWEPFEISAVPMGADAGAKVRTADKNMLNRCEVVRSTIAEPGGTHMNPETQPQPETRVEPQSQGAGTVVVEETAADIAIKTERERVQGIMKAVRAAKLPASFADDLIARGVDLLTARGLVLEQIERAPARDAGPQGGHGGIQVQVTRDPFEHVWRGIEGALLHRVDPVNFKMDDNAKQYRMHSLLRCAEECLEQRGVRTRGMSKMDIAGLALGLSVRAGMHTTSDFPLILADVANKTLRAAYEAAPQTFQAFSRRIPMPDFKAVKRNQLGEAPALEKVLEHGEFTRGTVAEGKEQFALSTYGRIFAITRQALVNDDLDAFGRMTTMFGRSARNLESDVVWYQILKNANMADGNALFSAAHANLVTGPGTVISVDSLGVLRAKLRKQTGLDSATYLNIIGRFLVVPPALETLADQYVTQIDPSQSSQVNPFAGRLSVISEPRLEGGVTLDGDLASGSATKWYMFADPSQIDLIEWGFLDGEDGPVVESRVGFDVDGLEIKCRHDFAAKAIDHRGMARNDGA